MKLQLAAELLALAVSVAERRNGPGLDSESEPELQRVAGPFHTGGCVRCTVP